MRKRKNRRTLRKRIRKAMSLSALITVIFLCGVLSYTLMIVSKGFAYYQAETISSTIQQEINSGLALRSLGILSLKDMDSNAPRTKEWLDGLSKDTLISNLAYFTNNSRKVYITIELEGNMVYTNEEADQEMTNQEEFSSIYQDTEVTKPILNKENSQIGSIRVKVNPELIQGILFPVLMILVAFSLLALFVARIMSIFLIIPIVKPLNQLEKKISAIAADDRETALNTQIILKRPLREMESLADSTNSIMKKLHGYNEVLEKQKDVLENQNAELEMQNEELVSSKSQIQKQQAQLVQSEKMASVGMLTAAITHEINTPIGAINSNLQLSDMLFTALLQHAKIQAEDELSTMITQLKEGNDVNLMACNRIIEIIKSLKSFSRLDQAEFQEANIIDGIKSVMVLTKNLLKNRITVHEQYEDIPLVKCFPGQLNQVIMNIIVNASQAIEGEGELFIHTYQKDKDIYISIKDTGTGIKQENLGRIFEPSFTTKGVGVGLGLGLYISYNIIQNHHGDLSVVSEWGKGAEFIIRIPIVNETEKDQNIV